MKANMCFNLERNGKAYWALHTFNNDPKQAQVGSKMGFYAKNMSLHDHTWAKCLFVLERIFDYLQIECLCSNLAQKAKEVIV